jgi:hypothetical protein
MATIWPGVPLLPVEKVSAGVTPPVRAGCVAPKEARAVEEEAHPEGICHTVVKETRENPVMHPSLPAKYRVFPEASTMGAEENLKPEMGRCVSPEEAVLVITWSVAE